MAEELRKDRSVPKFAQAITLYHLIVEGSLAQPGQHFIEDFFASEETMPGFSDGMANVSRDEQRHIGFGVKVLSELLEEGDPRMAGEPRRGGRAAAGSHALHARRLLAPGLDRSYTECYGFSIEDIFAFGLKLVRQRWRTIGFPTEEMPPGVFPFDPEKSDEEVAAEPGEDDDGRRRRLTRAGRRREATPELQRIHFDLITRVADPAAANGSPFILQWRFTDAEPWHLVLDNGSTRAEAGEAPSPNVTIEASWADWIASGKPDAEPAEDDAAAPHPPARQGPRHRAPAQSLQR